MIVALLSVSDGLTQTAAGFAHLGGSDLGVFQAGVSDPTVSVLPTSEVARLEGNPDVASATPLLLIVGKVPRDASAFVFGVAPSGFFAQRLVFASGGFPGRGEIAVGSGLAGSLHLRPATGSSSTAIASRSRASITRDHLRGRRGVLPLAVAQALTQEPGEATSIAVELTATRAPPPPRARSSASSPYAGDCYREEAARAGANGALIHNATLVIVIIALVLGAISVTNTMAMSVLERQGELAL